MPQVNASSFADPADLKAYRKAIADGKSEKEALAVGDNGIGKWGDDTTSEDEPACALPPEDWQPRWGKEASRRLVAVTYKGKRVVGELRDTMPRKAKIRNGAGIDLNPGFAKAFAAKPPFMLKDVEWQWVEDEISNEAPFTTTHKASNAIDYLERLPKPSSQGVNQGMTSPSSAFMITLLGLPHDALTGKCQPPNNPQFVKLIKTRRIGPIRVTGLKVALDSLERVFSDVRSELPDLYSMIGTEGMMCCRLKKIKGRVIDDPSNHCWGAAVDIKIGGVLDEQGDDLVQRGLLLLSRYFNAHGWYWGATFPTEDAMHFEPSREQLSKWRDQGLL